MSSCCTIRPITERAVILMSFDCNKVPSPGKFVTKTPIIILLSACALGVLLHKLRLTAAVVARQAPLARRAMRAWRAASRGWCRSTSTAKTGSFRWTRRPTTSPRHAAPAFMRLAAAFAERSKSSVELDRRRHRRHLRPAVHRALPGAVPVQPFRAPTSQDRRVRGILVRGRDHRSRRQSPLRPHRLVRRERVRLRFLQGVHRARQRARPRARARCWAPTIR